MTHAIKRELRFAQPPDAVWRALTDSNALAAWMYPNDFEPREGHKFTFRVPAHWDKFDGVVHCQVVTCVAPRELVFTWVGGEIDTRVSYRLEPDGTGTRVWFEHAGFEPGLALKGAELGWRAMHDKLARLVAPTADRSEPEPPAKEPVP